MMSAWEMLDAALTVSGSEAAPELRAAALMDAESTILEICHRRRLSQQMTSLQVSLALIYLSRMLAAGEESRTEGKVSVQYAYTKDVPEDLMRRILSYRQLKQAGVANAHKES